MRDADVFNAIQTALVATGAFDLVALHEPPEAAHATAEQARAVFLWPTGDAERQICCNPVLTERTVQYQVVVALRMDEPADRGPELERLAQVIANVVETDRSFGGLCVQHLTRIPRASNEKPKQPEQRTTLSGQFGYLLNLAARDTTPPTAPTN
jgi:hypothetical protein